jgi:hypothetical protein
LLGIALPVLAFAGEPRVQFSMVVTGTITVNPDGGVQDYSLDDVHEQSPIRPENPLGGR